MNSDEIKTTPDPPPRTQRRRQQMEVFPKAWMVEGGGRTDVRDSDRGVAAMEHEFVRSNNNWGDVRENHGKQKGTRAGTIIIISRDKRWTAEEPRGAAESDEKCLGRTTALLRLERGRGTAAARAICSLFFILFFYLAFFFLLCSFINAIV